MTDDQSYSLQEALERSTVHQAEYWVSKERGKKLLYVVHQDEGIIWLTEQGSGAKGMRGRPFSAYTAFLRRHGLRTQIGWLPAKESATYLKEREFFNALLSDIDIDL